MSEKVGDVEVLVGGGSESGLDVAVTDSTSTTASLVSSASATWHKAKLTLQVSRP